MSSIIPSNITSKLTLRKRPQQSKTNEKTTNTPVSILKIKPESILTKMNKNSFLSSYYGMIEKIENNTTIDSIEKNLIIANIYKSINVQLTKPTNNDNNHEINIEKKSVHFDKETQNQSIAQEIRDNFFQKIIRQLKADNKRLRFTYIPAKYRKKFLRAQYSYLKVKKDWISNKQPQNLRKLKKAKSLLEKIIVLIVTDSKISKLLRNKIKDKTGIQNISLIPRQTVYFPKEISDSNKSLFPDTCFIAQIETQSV